MWSANIFSPPPSPPRRRPPFIAASPAMRMGPSPPLLGHLRAPQAQLPLAANTDPALQVRRRLAANARACRAAHQQQACHLPCVRCTFKQRQLCAALEGGRRGGGVIGRRPCRDSTPSALHQEIGELACSEPPGGGAGVGLGPGAVHVLNTPTLIDLLVPLGAERLGPLRVQATIDCPCSGYVCVWACVRVWVCTCVRVCVCCPTYASHSRHRSWHQCA